MRLLADHNIESPLVTYLRKAGHDVIAVAEILRPEAPDSEVLARAAAEDRVLLTNDKDFGELAFFQRQVSSGIVLLRMPTLGTERKAARVERVLDQLEDRLQSALVVIGKNRVRRRVLPDL